MLQDSYLRIVFHLMLLTGLVGCTNMVAIQDFGRLSADCASYTALTQDYINAPRRIKKYTLPTDTKAREQLDTLYTQRQQQAPLLTLYHKSIETYMQALAEVASDHVPNYEQEMGVLVDATAQAGGISPDKTESVKSLTELLANASTNAYRQAQLRELIERANPALQHVLQDMIRLMRAYSASIDNEQVSFENYYHYLISLARRQLKSDPTELKEPAAAQFISDYYVEKIGTFADRLKAVNAYILILQTIAQAHQHLYDHRDDIFTVSTLNDVKAYASKIDRTYKLTRQRTP